jgi:hypothetical protein
LLISPEGHLTPVFQIEDAEKAPFNDPRFCFVKTQFGSLQGHIAIVHLLDVLRQQYCSNLEVSDEGEYYKNRDATKLIDKMRFVSTAISSVEDGLRKHGLSKEAAEDPAILASRIERIAALVQQKLVAPGCESDVGSPCPKPTDCAKTDDDNFCEPSLEGEVETIDRLRCQNDLRSQRMARRIAEATASGLSAEEAFELAMQDEGFPIANRAASDERNQDIEEPTTEEPTTDEP